MSEEALSKLSLDELTEAWPALSDEERRQGFVILSAEDGEEFLSHLSARDTFDLISSLSPEQRRRWLRLLPPDDIADMIQEAEEDGREAMLQLLDPRLRTEVHALLTYEEDVAGGLMNPRFARLRADMTASEAITYLRMQKSHNAEVIYYGYVVDQAQRLVGVVSFRELVTSPPEQRLRDIMTTDIVTVPDTMDQEEVSTIFAHEDLLCVPVVDSEGRMKGIVTADDIVDVVKEEATEDMHKLGGSQAVEGPYLQASVFELVGKRVGWLAILFFGQMLTVTVMGTFERQLETAVVLSLFVPLIISSGGNSGSQTATLVVRAMALGDIRLADWFLVLRREILIGLLLGLILCPIGLMRVLTWEWLFGSYGDYFLLIGLTIGLSVLGVVVWGTTVGACLPLILRRFGFDPASASTPLVATLVDVSGIFIYFTVATAMLRGTIL
ncbi:MAG: magnesium transporter [Phycisphaerales bacterium]|nr:magnesium transporter [Phycisphaerales bacterium]